MLRTLIYIINLLLIFAATATAGSDRYAQNSALAQGRWVKVAVTETGFYRLTYNDLKRMGFSDPSKVSVHGYGGYPLTEDFAVDDYKDDLPSIPVYRYGDMAIYFYARGVVKWTYNPETELFYHENNPYSTKGYYFITDCTPTDEVETEPLFTDTEQTLDTYDDYMLHEQEKVSLTNSGRPNSGRDLFGESFETGAPQDFKFATTGATNDDGRITYRFVAKIKSGTGTVSMSVDGRDIPEATAQIPENTYVYTAALSVAPTVLWQGEKTDNTTVRISFNMTAQTSRLDYIRLQFRRRLQLYGACTAFRCLAAQNKATRFVISAEWAQPQIFDVTTTRMKRMQTATEGDNFSFGIPADATLREFAVIDPINNTIPTPEIIGEVKPQNLHALPQLDMVILTPDAFAGEAERLAQAHRQYDNLSVVVVSPEKVYNEFSSGTPDATAIRRFMKMFYDRSAGEDDAPKYLLLLGDGRWDNRKLSDTWKNASENYLLTWQTRESLAENSYTSDDYFGMLADGEGASIVAATMNIGVGRFPVNTLAQAKTAVDKVIGYIEMSHGVTLTQSVANRWKNSVCFVADDGNSSDYDPTIHAQQADTLARYIEYGHPGFMPKKLYFDAFKRDYSAGKPTYPDIRTNLHKELNEGLLLLNYTGHGDALSWSEEKVMTQADILTSTYKNLPLWITASCDFAPFDAYTTSAGEDVFLNAKSGGIALFTAARVAYSDANLRINRLFLNYLFEKKDGRHLRLGDVMKNAKNDFRNERIMSFLLVGDPALTLAYPDDFNAVITEINDVPTENKLFNFKAFEKITLKGAITNADGNTVNDFNGLLAVTVYDGQREIETLNNSGGGSMKYNDYQNTIYTGAATVTNGAFTVSFTVPKDIGYSDARGKLSLYAVDATNRIEANGAFKHFTVNGTADEFVTDLNPPEIRALWLNTADFTNGDKVNTTPVLAAIIWDETGVNTGGTAIGHDITLTIDNNSAQCYQLNSYYQTYLEGEEGEGIVKFPLPALEEGKHTAELKVWDIFNNSVTRSINFTVADNYKPSIIQLTATPVPAKSYVDFLIAHNMPETLLTVEIQVFDLAGKLQWKHTETGSSDIFYYYSVRWDLTNGSGAKLPPGVYIYRAVVSSGTLLETSKANKLIIGKQ
jgi:hypothetical protein